MSQITVKPKSMQRAKAWSEMVEEGMKAPFRDEYYNLCLFISAYRFQLAGYRDEQEYLDFHKGKGVCSLCFIYT